jgi:hypothetical protein
MTPERHDDHSQPEAFNVEAWLTRPDQSALCAKQPGYLPVGSPIEGCPTIKVNTSRRYQATSSSVNLRCSPARPFRGSSKTVPLQADLTGRARC